MNFMLQTRHQLKPAPSNRPKKSASAQSFCFGKFMHLHDLSVGRRELPYAEHFVSASALESYLNLRKVAAAFRRWIL
jgi:hypothetical protein